MTEIKLDMFEECKWLGDKIACQDSNLNDDFYTFYSGLVINETEYNIGSAILLMVDKKTYFGCIHYFYENSNNDIPNRYMIAVELFYRPKEILNNLETFVILDDDIEVIKKDKIILVHFPITSIKRQCTLIYGLDDEEPYDILEEFRNQCDNNLLFVCRFIASFIDGKYKLRGAIINDKIDVNDTELENNAKCTIENNSSQKKYDKYVVTHIENNDKKIMIKVRRNLNDSFQELKNDSANSSLKDMNKITNDIKSPQQELASNFETLLIKSPTKESRTPVVLLNRLEDTQSEFKNVRSSLRRSSRHPENIENNPTVPIRASKRHTNRKSYADFYLSPENKQLTRNNKSSKIFDNTVISTPTKTKQCKNNNLDLEIILNHDIQRTPSRQKRASIVHFDTTTPKKQSKIIVNTPKSSRSLTQNITTPSIQDRITPIAFCNTPMSKARLGLSAHTMPAKMPCRENEYQNIYNFISTRIKDQTSGCMYISGVPGTGKTMTVCKVMNDLSKENYESGNFIFLKLNALALTEPRQIYVEIVKKLFHKKLHWEEALKEIIHFFKTKKKKMAHIILIDELDKLCNKKQDVVYNLLDLPFNSVTPLIVITIANTMDLPERILSNKVNSRLGLVRQTFKPYQYKDLVKIVTERLAANTVFKNEALELVTRKVAAVSGDARRALTMCSRATEIAEEENKELVTMDIVDCVIKEMSCSSKVQAIQCCSKLEQYILTAIANEVTRTGNEEVSFLNMLYNLQKICVLDNFKLPAIDILLKTCHNLGSFRLLITQHGKADIYMILMLNISTDDIHFALRNN